jgi:colanic acid biosynthesis glycosyl transferase WcaI
LAAGRPILAVVDHDGEVARLVREEGCGFHVALGDHEAFVQAVRALVADSSMTHAMGAAARTAATNRYSRAMALSMWRDLIRTTAAGGSAPERAKDQRLPPPSIEAA